MTVGISNCIDFNTYFLLLANALPDADAFGICDSRGVRAYSDHPDARRKLIAAVARLDRQDPAWHTGIDAIESREVAKGSRGFLAGLTDSEGASMGTLLILLSTDDGAAALDRIDPIVQCIRNEIALTSELNSMTAELTERYEELNLVYHTEDQVKYFREGRDALTQLVENCNDYLGVGLTALILKSKKIEVIRNAETHPLYDSQFVVTRLQEELYGWVESNNETVVINDIADDRTTSLIRGVPYKVLCAPVLDGGGSVAGILVIVNEFSKANFTNSDRNLLCVMARKAGKIIQANYDALTGLVNRGGFEYFLESAVAQVRGTSKQHCVLHLNIDQLRVVNDTAGHHAGDEVIRQIVATSAAHLRETDTLARLGGDQFGVLLESCTSAHGNKIAEQIRKSVEKLAIAWDERTHKVTVSIGIATLSAETDDLKAALAGAELACGECSEQGGNRIEMYHDENSELVQRRKQMQLVEKIQSAISNDNFELYSQPIVPLQIDDGPLHFEILLRMIDGQDLIAPGLFIPAAERYHLMPAIDRWVVSRAIDMLASLPRDTLLGNIFAINLSGQSLGDNEFLEFLDNTVAASPVPKESICFEITETAAIRNLAHAKHFITTLGARGCQFSLDDFGVGLSSFSYLKTLPVDHLKIDGEFVRDLLEDRVSAAMVAAINQIGHTMGLQTIAEFVENDAIRAQLVLMGVDYAQGFGIAVPIPFSDQLESLREANPAVAAL